MSAYRGRPTKKHVIWTRETRDGASKKRFDNERFERWANHYGFGFETSKRVDHDRTDEPRMQFRCVFAWGQTEGESFEFGDEEWELGSQKTPRTFVEIDEAGLARIKSWDDEAVLDVAEMRYDGPALFLETGAGEKTRLDGQKLVTRPDESPSEP